MKLTITLLAIIILASCKNEGGSATPPKIIQRDTVNTIIGTVGYQRKEDWFGPAKRITADSFAFVSSKLVNEDSLVIERKWKKITYYLANLPVMVDSAISVAFQIARYDSSGKPYPVNIPVHLDPKFVVDGITDVDSAKRYLSQFLIKDTTKR
jgi:hypothetical protein